MEANGGMLGGRSFVEMDVAESVAQQAGRVDRSEARWEKRGVSENGVRMCDYVKRHTGTLWVCCRVCYRVLFLWRGIMDNFGYV